jgi:hypothetical protein
MPLDEDHASRLRRNAGPGGRDDQGINHSVRAVLTKDIDRCVGSIPQGL